MAPADCTTQAASEDELRRRITEGDQNALAELLRRQAAAENWARTLGAAA